MIFKEIMREYDKLGNNAKRLLEDRKQEVYEIIPRIKEIDTEIMRIGLSIAKSAIGIGSEQSQQLVKDMEIKHKKLIQEKNELMSEYKYPLDYFTDIYACRHCQDTGFILNEKCACFKQKIINKYYMISNLSDVLEYENFDMFDYRLYSTEKEKGENKSPHERIMDIHQTASNFVKNFGKDFSNLLFYGATGLGKTFMCNCIAKDLLDKGHTVLYTTSSELFKNITDHHFNKNEDNMSKSDLINFIYTVDLLIIDDLGTELATVLTSSEFFNFINARLLAKKPVVISTNLFPKEIKTIYSSRIASRILGNYVALNFLGVDIRLQKKFKRKKS